MDDKTGIAIVNSMEYTLGLLQELDDGGRLTFSDGFNIGYEEGYAQAVMDLKIRLGMPL